MAQPVPMKGHWSTEALPLRGWSPEKLLGSCWRCSMWPAYWEHDSKAREGRLEMLAIHSTCMPPRPGFGWSIREVQGAARAHSSAVGGFPDDVEGAHRPQQVTNSVQGHHDAAAGYADMAAPRRGTDLQALCPRRRGVSPARESMVPRPRSTCHFSPLCLYCG